MRIFRAMLFFALGLSFLGISGCDLLQSGQFRDNGDGTITDTEAGLTWFRCTVGQRWSGDTCEGQPILMSHKEARRAAEGFSYANRTNWRLPSPQESHLIIYCSNHTKSPYIAGQEINYCSETDESRFTTPTIDKVFFPGAIVTPSNAEEIDNVSVFKLITWTSGGASKNIMGIDIRRFAWGTSWISGELSIYSDSQEMAVLLVSDEQ